MNRLNKTDSAVSLYCRFSLFLKDPFFQVIHGSAEKSNLDQISHISYYLYIALKALNSIQQTDNNVGILRLL